MLKNPKNPKNVKTAKIAKNLAKTPANDLQKPLETAKLARIRGVSQKKSSEVLNIPRFSANFVRN